MNVLIISASLFCILLMQISKGSSKEDSDYRGISTRAITAGGLMNCSNPGEIYPLVNGCNGWYICGRNKLVYPNSCGASRCYNNTNGRCTITKTPDQERNTWFDCNGSNARKFLAWKQDPKVYGLCISAGLVTSMDKCPNNMTFDENSQDCTSPTTTSTPGRNLQTTTEVTIRGRTTPRRFSFLIDENIL